MKRHPVAYVLFIEHRLCKSCGQVHLVPGRRPRVQLASNTSIIETEDINLYYPDKGKFPPPDLPRRQQHIETSVEVCHECYPNEDVAQEVLFPTPVEAPMTVKAIEATRKTGLPSFGEFD